MDPDVLARAADDTFTVTGDGFYKCLLDGIDILLYD